MPRFQGLSGNMLKIIAAISMLIDHVGVMLFPELKVFRIIGRLSFPIFAFMIAEGCRYTRNRLRYFLMIFCLAAVCQIVYYVYDRDLYMCVLVTFALSILVICPMQNCKSAERGAEKCLWALVTAAAAAGVWLLNQRLTIDYGFWGCMLPVFASAFQGRGKGAESPLDRKEVHVLAMGVGLLLLAADSGGIQAWSLLALPLLMAYSGRVGKWRMKYFFYVFYPVHLAVLQAVALLLR